MIPEVSTNHSSTYSSLYSHIDHPNTPIYSDVPGSGLFYVLYSATTQRYGETSSSVMLAGGLGGMAMWLWGVPPDVLKTKFQTAPPGKYNSFLDVAPELVNIADWTIHASSLSIHLFNIPYNTFFKF